MPRESHAADAPPDPKIGPGDEPTILVRKLGSPGIPTYLERILTEDGESQFVVVERLSRGGMTDEEVSACVRDARVAVAIDHPNVVRTRAVIVRSDEISVVSDYVAGERLSELWSLASGSTAKFPLEIALRILVDVSTGLGALHKLRSGEGQGRTKFVHGEVTAANVLVGLDGVSTVLRAARVRRAHVPPSLGIGSIAPEALSGATMDQRADVYSLGALLWQALSGRPLFRDDDIGAILASTKQGAVARAVVASDAPWALPLADVAARALAPEPDARFPTASSMITELRRIAGSKLATAVQVAEFVESTAGERIAARLSNVPASAVVRKAASIPAPPSSPIQEPAVVATTTEILSPSVSPRIEIPREPAALPPAPLPPAPLPLAAPLSPGHARRPPPPLPPGHARPPPPLPLARERPPAPTKVIPKRSGAVAPSLVATRGTRALPAPEPTPSPFAQRALRWGIGVFLALTLFTGWLAMRAVRDRQVIVTTEATSAAPGEASLGTGVASDVTRAEVRPMAGMVSTTKLVPARPPAPRKTPPSKIGQK